MQWYLADFYPYISVLTYQEYQEVSLSLTWFDNCGYSHSILIPKKIWQVFHFVRFDS